MPVFLQQIIGSVVRSLLAAGLGWLVVHGWTTAEVVEQTLPAIVGLILTVLWSIYQKYIERQKVMTAMSMRSGVSEIDVKKLISTGAAISVMTAPDTKVG